MLKFVLIFIVIVIAAYAGYRYYLPSKIAESITSGEKSSFLPDEIQEKLEAFKTKTSTDVGALPELMVEADIDYVDLETMLDRLDPKQVSGALKEMSAVNITSAEQAFDILIEHIEIEGYQLDAFRDMFVRNTDAEDIRHGLVKVEEYGYLISFGMPVAIEVAKGVLESSRPEIENRLLALKSNQ